MAKSRKLLGVKVAQRPEAPVCEWRNCGRPATVAIVAQGSITYSCDRHRPKQPYPAAWDEVRELVEE